MSTGEHVTSRRFRVVGRTNPGVVLPPGSGWSLTAGLAEDPPFQVSVFTGYEESDWSAPVARVLYLVVDLAAASLQDAVAEALGSASGLTTIMAFVGNRVRPRVHRDPGPARPARRPARLPGRYQTHLQRPHPRKHPRHDRRRHLSPGRSDVLQGTGLHREPRRPRARRRPACAFAWNRTSIPPSPMAPHSRTTASCSTENGSASPTTTRTQPTSRSESYDERSRKVMGRNTVDRKSATVDYATSPIPRAVQPPHRRRQDQGPGPPHHRPVASALTCNDIRPRSTHGGFRPYLC